VAVIEIHQCPRCELRFEDEWELKDHLASEHPGAVDDDTFEEGERP
jgi:Zn-finger nucleic acid-binding protein